VHLEHAAKVGIVGFRTGYAIDRQGALFCRCKFDLNGTGDVMGDFALQ
jgi:hypothetical protein